MLLCLGDSAGDVVVLRWFLESISLVYLFLIYRDSNLLFYLLLSFCYKHIVSLSFRFFFVFDIRLFKIFFTNRFVWCTY